MTHRGKGVRDARETHRWREALVSRATTLALMLAVALMAEVDAVLGAGLSGTLVALGGLALLIGLILFGAATMRAGVFPRWAGLLLTIGDVVPRARRLPRHDERP